MSSNQSSNNPHLVTNQYYNENAQDFYQRTYNLDLSSVYPHFMDLLPAGAHILDAGCGSGRDSLFFIQKGYSVTALDASRELVQLASRLMNQPVLNMTFSQMEFQEEFDGIWAFASLLHVPRSDMNDVLQHLSNALKPGGVLYASLKHGVTETFRKGRWYNDYDENSALELFHVRKDLKLYKLWVTKDPRPELSENWVNILLKKHE